jgi:transposase
MPRSRAPYPQEYRDEILALVRAGRTPDELAREYEPTAQTIRSWVAEARALEQGRPKDELGVNEKEELRRLRREVKILRQEKEILKKAAIWFARESGQLPDESTVS